MPRKKLGTELTDQDVVFLANVTRERATVKLWTYDDCYTCGKWKESTQDAHRRKGANLIENLRNGSAVPQPFDHELYESNSELISRLRLPKSIQEQPSPPSTNQGITAPEVDTSEDGGVNSAALWLSIFPGAGPSSMCYTAQSDPEISDLEAILGVDKTVIPDRAQHPLSSFTCSSRTPQIPLGQTLAGWVVKNSISQEHLTDLLKHLRRLNGQEYQGLPKDGRTLLKDRLKLKKMFPVYEIFDSSSLPIQRLKKTAASGNPMTSEGERIGHFVYFGLYAGALGRTPGCVEYYAQLKEWRQAYVVSPDFFNEELFAVTKNFVGLYDDWDDVVTDLKLKNVKHQNSSPPSQVSIKIDINYDGVSVKQYNAQSPQMYPVLGCITGLQTQDGRNFKFSFEMPPFIIGFYLGSRKPPPEKILSHVAKEFIRHHPSKSSSPVTLLFHAAIADAPALADMKGTVGATGYYGLPRCTQRGIHVDSTQDKENMTPSRNGQPASDSNLPAVASSTTDASGPPPKKRRKTGAVAENFAQHVPASSSTTAKKKVMVRFPVTKCWPQHGWKWNRYSKPMKNDKKVHFEPITS